MVQVVNWLPLYRPAGVRSRFVNFTGLQTGTERGRKILEERKMHVRIGCGAFLVVNSHIVLLFLYVCVCVYLCVRVALLLTPCAPLASRCICRCVRFVERKQT